MFGVFCFLLIFNGCNGQAVNNLNLGHCRMSCDQEGNTASLPYFSSKGSQGRPGKRGIKGETGRKGEKGEPCQCVLQTAKDVEKVQNQLQNLQIDCPQTKYFFPTRTQPRYIRMKTPIENMASFSVCAWITPLENQNLSGSFISYNTATTDNVLVMIFTAKLDIYIHSVAASHFSVNIARRTHVCVVISMQRGWMKVYLDGSPISKQTFTPNAPIVGGGEMVIGEEQDSLLGSFEKNQALTGTVENLMIWTRQLGDYEIQAMYANMCACAKYHTIALTTEAVDVVGDVRAETPDEDC
ncbi:C-reactive protein-like [Styela clava]